MPPQFNVTCLGKVDIQYAQQRSEFVGIRGEKQSSSFLNVFLDNFRQKQRIGSAILSVGGEVAVVLSDVDAALGSVACQIAQRSCCARHTQQYLIGVELSNQNLVLERVFVTNSSLLGGLARAIFLTSKAVNVCTTEKQKESNIIGEDVAAGPLKGFVTASDMAGESGTEYVDPSACAGMTDAD